jgi:hypothetical protein
MTASFCGLSPAVIALIVHLACRIAKLGMDDWLQWVIAAGCCLVTIWRDPEEALLFIGQYSRHPPLRLVVSPRQHAAFAARRRPLGHQQRKGAGVSAADSLAILFRLESKQPTARRCNRGHWVNRLPDPSADMVTAQ